MWRDSFLRYSIESQTTGSQSCVERLFELKARLAYILVCLSDGITSSSDFIFNGNLSHDLCALHRRGFVEICLLGSRPE